MILNGSKVDFIPYCLVITAPVLCYSVI